MNGKVIPMFPKNGTNVSETTSETESSFDEWLAYGMSKRWVGPIVCDTHDGVPCSESEAHALWDGNDDICISIIRVYESDQHADEVERDHTPSQWRKSNWHPSEPST